MNNNQSFRNRSSSSSRSNSSRGRFQQSSNNGGSRRDSRNGSRGGSGKSFNRGGSRSLPKNASFSSYQSSKNSSHHSKNFSNKDTSNNQQSSLFIEQGFHPLGKFPRVFSERKGRTVKYFVESVRGKVYFDEFVLRREGKAFREVNPERSKLFASIALGISQIGFKQDSSVLYLGASHGFTVSFLADMVIDGEIYALDFAPRVLRDLVFLCEDYPNMAPIMADANKIEEYSDVVPLAKDNSGVDVVFMDISQRNQTEIFLKNCDAFLKQGGFGLLALKARSIDVTKKPKDVFKIVRSELESRSDYSIVDYKELSPLEQDHAMFVVKKK